MHDGIIILLLCYFPYVLSTRRRWELLCRMDPTPPPDIAHEPSRKRIAEAISELQRLRHCPAEDRGIAFVDPRWEDGEHGLTMIARLVCGNPTLKADLVNESAAPADRTQYAYTITYDAAKNSYVGQT